MAPRHGLRVNGSLLVHNNIKSSCQSRQIARLTNCTGTEGEVCICWGCHLVLAIRTPGSILDPTLSRRTVWIIVEHSPKLRAFLGIRVATECLEEKHSLRHVCNVLSHEIGILLVWLTMCNTCIFQYYQR